MCQPCKSSDSKLNILVVDDDATSLSILSALLKSCQHEVLTVKCPYDALATLSVKSFDLVITDLHMPKMNGLQLQKEIAEEYKLPVIIISSDDRESAILKSLASGVVRYIVKPIKPDDLKNLSHYVIASRIGKSISIEEMGSVPLDGSSNDIASSASSVNERKQNHKDYSKRKFSSKGKEYQEGENIYVAPKKSKVVWTSSLHGRFLQAIKHLTLEKAVPKKILEFMNVPGLTRENVASHLQKYRFFLKMIVEKGCGILCRNFSERALRSSFASGELSLLLENVIEYAQITGNKHQLRALLDQVRCVGSILTLNSTTIGTVGFPSLGTSSNNSVSSVGSLGDQVNFHQSPFGGTHPLYQENSFTTFATGSNNTGTYLLSSAGGASGYENVGTIITPYSNFAGINGVLNGNGINGTGNLDAITGLTGKATFPYLAQGESSNSAGLQNGNYQFSPTNATSPYLAQEKSSNFAGLQNGNYQFPPTFIGANAQQNVLNPNFPGSSYQPEVNLPNQSQNSDLDGAFGFDDYAPWVNIEPTLEQLLEIDEFEDPDFGEIHYLADDYYPSFDKNPTLQQGSKESIDYELNDMHPLDKNGSENQDWQDEELIHSLLADRPF